MQPEKVTFKSIVHSKPVLVLLFFLLIFFGYNVVQIIKKSHTVRKERILAEERKEHLESQKADLEQHLVEIQTEEGAEKMLREKFRIVKEQEGLIVIVDDTLKQEIPEKIPAHMRVKAFFRNIFQ